MTTINLKDFYAWYTHDEYIEVSDEVAAELKADKLYEAAHQRRTTRNKAQYSLDCDDGIEYSACLHEPTPQELLDRMELFLSLIHICYVLHVDLSDIRELVALQRRCANNLNQVAVHANTYGIYPSEIAALQKDYANLWEPLSELLKKLSAVVSM